MRIFLAGIMQGSHLGTAMHNQDYRTRLKQLLREHVADAEVYDPLADHTNSLDYDDDLGRGVFMRHNELCSEVDVVLAFVPEASMGTAIEMWQAHRHGRRVVTISALKHNWAVKFLSDILYADLTEFEEAVISGALGHKLKQFMAEREQP